MVDAPGQLLPRYGLVYAPYFPPFPAVVKALFEGIRPTGTLGRLAVITPHAGAASPYCMKRVMKILIENLHGFLRNEPLLHEMDRRLGH